jgi:hypothetical protein
MYAYCQTRKNYIIDFKCLQVIFWYIKKFQDKKNKKIVSILIEAINI